MRIVGYVSERESSSSSSASQTTFERAPWAPLAISSSPRYEPRPPSFEIDLAKMFEVVFGAAWTILPPASWCWPLPANAIERISPWARSPIRYTLGYFMVSLEPRLQSTHSTVASVSATARLVTRLNTLLDQFWTVVSRMRAPGLAITSTTAECSDELE